jgi:hypothetical protein
MEELMNEPKTVAEKIAKLPVWAQEHIKTLDRERTLAVRALSEYLDDQTPSAIFTEDMHAHSVGELTLPGGHVQRKYVNADKIIIEAHGVRLDVMTKYGNTNNESIVLQWSTPNRMVSEVAMIPLSYQQVRLIAKGKMR